MNITELSVSAIGVKHYVIAAEDQNIPSSCVFLHRVRPSQAHQVDKPRPMGSNYIYRRHVIGKPQITVMV